VIDKSDDPELDQARRSAIVAHLQQCGFSDVESRVVVGRGEAEGLYGVEAPFITPGFFGGAGSAGRGGVGRGGGSGGLGSGFGGGFSGFGGIGGFGGGIF
jgi:hypothetical protein